MTLLQVIDEVLGGFGYVWQGHEVIASGARLAVDGVWTGPGEAGEIVVHIRVPESERHAVRRRLRALLMLVGAASARPLTVILGPAHKDDELVTELRRLVRLVAVEESPRNVIEKTLSFLAPLEVPRISESVPEANVLASQVLADVSDPARARNLSEAASESGDAVEDLLRHWLTEAAEGGEWRE